MTRNLKLPLTVLFIIAFALPARTQADGMDKGAGQIVGLFMQACVSHYGNIQAARNWLEDHKVPHMPDTGAVRFLNGGTGVVYDASNAIGRYGVATKDDGVCDAFAETAKASDVIEFLERLLKSRGLTVIRLKDNSEPHDVRLHHYFYLIIRNGVNYDLVASVSDAPQVMQAQLGFWQRGPSETLPTPLPPPR
jgi:hypothetical protein